MSFDQLRLTLLLEMHKYNSELAKQYFDYREKLTAIVMVAYAGITSIMLTLSFSLISFPLSVIMMIIARYAEFFVMKFYERSEYHFSRCRQLRKQIDIEYGNAYKSLTEIFSEANEFHVSHFTLRNRITWLKPILEANTHDRWGSLHRVFFFVGLFFGTFSLGKAIYDRSIPFSEFLNLVRKWIV